MPFTQTSRSSTVYAYVLNAAYTRIWHAGNRSYIAEKFHAHKGARRENQREVVCVCRGVVLLSSSMPWRRLRLLYVVHVFIAGGGGLIHVV